MTRVAHLPALSEADFQRQVIDIAHAFRWRVAHFRAAKTEQGWRTPVQADGAGFVDLVLVRATELLFVELKAERGRVRPEQVGWLDALRLVAAAVDDAYARLVGIPGATQPPPCVEVHLWRPSQIDEIAARLSRPPTTLREPA